MNNCLVTKLNAVVNNDELELLDRLHINVREVTEPDSNNYGILISRTPASRLFIEGSGYFTDSTRTQNLGKESYTGNKAYFSNGNYKITIPLTGITNISAGNLNAGALSDWQVEGLNYDRLCSLNSETLEKIMFKYSKDLERNIKHLTNVTWFGLVGYNEGQIDIQEYLNAIVEQSGRTSNFAFSVKKGKDAYSTGNFIRNIHIETQNTKYTVYNSANTSLIYTAEKVSGVWQYTMA